MTLLSSSALKNQNKSNIQGIISDNSLTFAEKVISIKGLQLNDGDDKKSRQLMAGDIAVVAVDLSMAQDSTGPLAIRSLNEMRLDKIHNPKRVLLVIDHTFPAADEKVANLHAMMR